MTDPDHPSRPRCDQMLDMFQVLPLKVCEACDGLGCDACNNSGRVFDPPPKKEMRKMSKKTRHYEVVNKKDPTAKPRLVDAGTRSQAVGHVVRDTYEAKPVSHHRLVELLGQGVKVETAAVEDPE